jgi:uncharacterized protein YbjT (DUF2867 family)
MILVTGAGGFIDSQVCRLLSTRGYAVVAINRRSYFIASMSAEKALNENSSNTIEVVNQH